MAAIMTAVAPVHVRPVLSLLAHAVVVARFRTRAAAANDDLASGNGCRRDAGQCFTAPDVSAILPRRHKMAARRAAFGIIVGAIFRQCGPFRCLYPLYMYMYVKASTLASAEKGSERPRSVDGDDGPELFGFALRFRWCGGSIAAPARDTLPSEMFRTSLIRRSRLVAIVPALWEWQLCVLAGRGSAGEGRTTGVTCHVTAKSAEGSRAPMMLG